ncbi:MAG TPA: LamG domain-containing protein [Labilithrix sp.]|nr:LamG domain-containing protein [Labilithrix sp.]
MIRQPARTEALLVTLALGAAVAGASSCRTPTQTTIEVVSELAYRSDMAVAIQLGSEDDVETAPPRVVTRGAWAGDGTVGTVVAVPDEDEAGILAIRVVLAVGRDPASCSAADAQGCVVVRRTSRFSPHESSHLRIVLRPSCLGIFCDARTSCARDGACGSLASDQEAGDAGADGGATTADAGADPYAAAVLADRPRHYYRFDEPPGSRVARDATGRADGTYEGAVTLGVTGALGTSTASAAYFDGREASVVMPKVQDLPGAASFEAWVRSDGPADGEPTIFERLDRVGSDSFGYRFSRPPETLAAFAVFRGGSAASASARAIRFAGYNHVVAVTRAGEIDVYVDGAPAARALFTDGPPAPVLAPFVVGQSRTGGGPWRGAIDELAIYDYPLTLEQMNHHRQAAGEPRSP